jgi:predicted phosphodiesterase
MIAIFADIHGNLDALDVVLADIDRRGITQIINLGDCAYGAMHPGTVTQRLMERNILTIAGNQDRIINDPDAEVALSPSYEFTLSQLNAEQMAWYAALPPTTVVGDIFCCHGTPASDTSYLLEAIRPDGRVWLKSSHDIARLLEGISQSVIVCGHSHVPHIVGLPDGRMVVNPGSVGLPAYTDELPLPHGMEAGSPHARYAVLDQTAAGWSVEHIALTYDWAAAARTAEANGRPDYVPWLLTGRAEISP